MTTTGTRVLTLNDTEMLAQLLRGVQAGATMRYYPMGADDAERPVKVVLRAFTDKDGNFPPGETEVRDMHVWTSGTFEHWYPVSELIKAIDNAATARYGLSEPMAIIEWTANE